MKNIKLLIITFIFPLILINCSNQYDGGTYTGSSLSSKKIDENSDQKTIVIEEKLTPETTSTQSADQIIENEDNYK
ncbi:MAG: hypothetical protein CML85_07505 [Rhodobiaceae bacterium]|nr:hypothetical protein [Rhodobiaceae bacterium]|tara:strand:- start:19 stop:246 length:228 start_codon:yes stop_codon:yes gene_type:complete